MRFRFWQFALLIVAILGLGIANESVLSRALGIGHMRTAGELWTPTDTNNLEYVVSWFVAVIGTSLFGFYIMEAVRLLLPASGNDKQKPAESIGVPSASPAPPDGPTLPGLSRRPACPGFR